MMNKLPKHPPLIFPQLTHPNHTRYDYGYDCEISRCKNPAEFTVYRLKMISDPLWTAKYFLCGYHTANLPRFLLGKCGKPLLLWQCCWLNGYWKGESEDECECRCHDEVGKRKFITANITKSGEELIELINYHKGAGLRFLEHSDYNKLKDEELELVACIELLRWWK